MMCAAKAKVITYWPACSVTKQEPTALCSADDGVKPLNKSNVWGCASRIRARIYADDPTEPR